MIPGVIFKIISDSIIVLSGLKSHYFGRSYILLFLENFNRKANYKDLK